MLRLAQLRDSRRQTRRAGRTAHAEQRHHDTENPPICTKKLSKSSHIITRTVDCLCTYVRIRQTSSSRRLKRLHKVQENRQESWRRGDQVFVLCGHEVASAAAEGIEHPTESAGWRARSGDPFGGRLSPQAISQKMPKNHKQPLVFLRPSGAPRSPFRSCRPERRRGKRPRGTIGISLR